MPGVPAEPIPIEPEDATLTVETVQVVPVEPSQLPALLPKKDPQKRASDNEVKKLIREMEHLGLAPKGGFTIAKARALANAAALPRPMAPKACLARTGVTLDRLDAALAFNEQVLVNPKASIKEQLVASENIAKLSRAHQEGVKQLGKLAREIGEKGSGDKPLNKPPVVANQFNMAPGSQVTLAAKNGGRG